jgi:hypothetical protein
MAEETYLMLLQTIKPFIEKKKKDTNHSTINGPYILHLLLLLSVEKL